jgi:hypothetical protein
MGSDRNVFFISIFFRILHTRRAILHTAPTDETDDVDDRVGASVTPIIFMWIALILRLASQVQVA